jgi:transposase
MARRGRPTVEITLSAEERATLQRWARRHSSAQALALRSKIVLACAAGDRTHAEIAAELGCNPVTVGKWRHRFAEDRLDGLVDAPRPGAARSIGDDVVEAVVVETLETAPPDATHWSTRGLAAKHGISHTTVREIWRAFGLKPWRQDSFKVSARPRPRRQDPRPRRALHEPAGRRGGVRGGREAADPSAQPDRADPADAAHHPPAGHPRLRTQRHL